MSTEIIYNTYDNEASIVHDDIVNDKVLKVATAPFGDSNTKDVLEYPLAENLLEVQSYGFSQFIKTSFLVRKAEVILNIDDENIVVAEAENIEMNHWYRLEGFFTMDELKKVDFNNATLRLRITKAFNDPEIYIYRPCLSKGDTIPDWFPSLEEIVTPEMGLEGILRVNNKIPSDLPIVFEVKDDPNLPGLYSLPLEISTGPFGRNFIANGSNEIDPERLFINNNIIGTWTGINLKGGWSNHIIGGMDDVEYASCITAIGSSSLKDFKGVDLSHYNSFAAPHGKVTPNVALGHHAGKGLLEGWGNMYFGVGTAGRPPVEKHQLVVHMGSGSGYGDDNPENTTRYALLRGDFLRRWFQIAGKLRLNNKQNAPITDFSEAGEMAVLSSKPQPKTEYVEKKIMVQQEDEEGNPMFDENDEPIMIEVTELNADGSKRYVSKSVQTTHSKQMEIVNAKEYILHQIEGMDSEQLTRLITKLPIEEKEVVTYNSSNPRPATGEEGKLYVDTDEDKGYLWDKETQSYVGIGVVDLSNYYDKQEADGLLVNKEDAFTKNTAFNKDFGTTTNTVARGDHTHSELHTHSNKSTLDGITPTKVSEWDSKAEGNHTHSELHTHSNKGVLDTITADDLVDYFEAHQKTVTGVSFTGDVNKTLTVTRQDGTTLTASFVDKEGDGGGVTDGVLNTLEFNTTTGVLTATVLNGTTEVPIDLNLDGRYSLIGHTHELSDVSGLNDALASKEPKIATKNTAFNKNFGTTSGTVAQGNDSRFHTHSNKSVLDGITSSKVSEWNGKAEANHTHTISDIINLAGEISDLNDKLGSKEDSLGNPTENGQVLISTTNGVRSWVSVQSYKKTFLGEYGNAHTIDVSIDTTQFKVGDEWIITYNGATLPFITLDGSKKAKLIDVGINFEAGVVNRIYLHLVQISGTDYYFDVTATPTTLL